MFYIESHWIHQNTWKAFVCCLFSGCGINAFRMTSSNSSPAEKSCACAYIAFLAGIFSCYADSTWYLTNCEWWYSVVKKARTIALLMKAHVVCALLLRQTQKAVHCRLDCTTDNANTDMQACKEGEEEKWERMKWKGKQVGKKREKEATKNSKKRNKWRCYARTASIFRFVTRVFLFGSIFRNKLFREKERERKETLNKLFLVSLFLHPFLLYMF
jgi:hypothetical protein